MRIEISFSLLLFEIIGLPSKFITKVDLEELLLVLKYCDWVSCCLRDWAECFGRRRIEIEKVKFRKNVILKDWGGQEVGETYLYTHTHTSTLQYIHILLVVSLPDWLEIGIYFLGLIV